MVVVMNRKEYLGVMPESVEMADVRFKALNSSLGVWCAEVSEELDVPHGRQINVVNSDLGAAEDLRSFV
jgi:hypothetical protein